MEGPSTGLRERKKRETRATIARAAMELFQARGFDAVTVADVARAADVSEKTVFNHFAAKEDLVFVAGAERRAAIIEEIRALPAGASVVPPFRAATMAYLDAVERGPVDGILAIPRLVMGSQALRNRLFLGWEEEAAALAPAIAEHVGDAPDDITPAVIARTLAWTHRLTVRTAFRRLLAGEDERAVAADLRAQADRAYRLLEGGLAEYWR